jgi:hypothetical protein
MPPSRCLLILDACLPTPSPSSPSDFDMRRERMPSYKLQTRHGSTVLEGTSGYFPLTMVQKSATTPSMLWAE